MRKGKGAFADQAIRYAEQVRDGEIVACRQIRRACDAFLRDVDGDDWTFDAGKVERVCLFAHAFPYLTGPLAAKRMKLRLEPWQVWILAALFGLVDARGLRKHREALIMIPRKNGKSTFAAVIALYMLVADREPRAQVYIGANSTEQAGYCFQPCRDFAVLAPGFARHYQATVTKKMIELADGSFLKAMIGKPGDGGNPHCAILDEAHENDSDEQRLTMKTGMNAREQPLLVTITTAGFNTAGPCRDLQLYAEQVLDGELKNERLFSAIYTVDKDDDWRDFDAWVKANPNAGVAFSLESLRESWQTALDKPSEKPKLLTKHLNVWQSSSNAWVNMKEWDDNANAPAFETLVDQGKRAWIGADISKFLDNTSIVALVEHEGALNAYKFSLLPELGVERTPKNASAYRQWAEEGHLELTELDETDYGRVKTRINALCGQFNVQTIAMDQWQARMLAQEVQKENPGVEVVEYPQNFQNMNPAMSKFEKELALGRLKHDGNPMFRWHTGNVCAKHHDDFIRPVKPDRRPESKIDGFVALMMALGVSMKEAAPVEVWMDVL